MKPVIVIGGGIVGISTAIWLQRAGKSVTLIDRGNAEAQASYGNAGVLASSSVIPVTTPGIALKIPKMLLDPKEPLFVKLSYLPRLAPWALRYLSHSKASEVRRIAAALRHIIGDSLEDHLALAGGTSAAKRIIPTDFTFMYESQSAFEKDGFGWSVKKELGFEWDSLSEAERKAYDPVFAPDLTFAARLGNHGRINDPSAYVADLTSHFSAQGGTVLKGEVEDFILENGQITGVRVGGAPLEASAVAVTAGAWSTRLTSKLGIKIPLEAESGYHLEFWEPNQMPRSPSLIPSGKFIATPMEGRLRVAGMVEFGGLENQASQAPFDLLRKNAIKAIPGLTWKEETQWMGHRPAPTDSVPIIDQVPGAPGVFMGFGHQHVGLTGGARTGQLLSQLISNQKPNIDMAPYACDRFA